MQTNMQTNILNQAQAEAVYSAMCALNNVGGRIAANIGVINVYESIDGWVQVTSPGLPTEVYATQSEFATAYGLQ